METWKIKYEEERTLGDFFAFLFFVCWPIKSMKLKLVKKKKAVSARCGDSKVVVSQLNFAETLDSCCSYLT